MILTQKAYALISLEKYNQEKQTYLNSLSHDYHNSSLETKWLTVINKYSEIDPELASDLKSFSIRCVNATLNAFNLSLGTCLSYFENFCFLATTEHTTFKLSTDQRRILKESIKDALNTCETGKNARFHQILQLNRQDETSWVTKILADNRYNLVLQLQETYNGIYYVPRSLAIHTLHFMTILSEKRHLGIKVDHHVDDNYLTALDKKSIEQYFDRHFPALFREYEEQMINTLSLHILFEITSRYDSPEYQAPHQRRAHNNWEENQKLIISAAHTQEFSCLIENLLGFKEDSTGEAIIYSLGHWNAANDFELINKQAFLSKLSSFIKQKLLNEEYYLDFSQITASNLEEKATLIHTKPKEILTVALELNNILKNFDQDNTQQIEMIKAFVHKYHTLILQYPDIILDALSRYPSLYPFLPSKLTCNALFVNRAIGTFNLLLNEAWQKHDAEAFNTRALELADLTQRDLHYFRQLSPALQENETLALQLLKKNGLLYQELPLSLQKNQTIVNAALAQNCFAFLYLPSDIQPLHANIEKAVQRHFDCIYGKPIQQTIENIRTIPPHAAIRRDERSLEAQHAQRLTPAQLIKDHTIYQLLTEDNLSIMTLAKLTETLTPAQLIKIVKWRKENHKPALAHCHDVSILERFNDKLSARGIYNWCEGYFSVKKEASSRLCYTPNSETLADQPIAFLANTNHWFIAFASYQYWTQGAFKNSEQFWKHMKKTCQSFLNMLLSILKAVIFVILGILTSFLITAAIQFSLWAFFALFVISLGSFLISILNRNPIFLGIALVFLCGIIFLASSLVVTLNLLVYAAMGFKVDTFFAKWAIDCSDLLKKSFKMLFPSHEAGTFSLMQQCENRIGKLYIQGNPASTDQAAILEVLLNKVTEDLLCMQKDDDIDTLEATEDVRLQRLLDKPYTVSYQNKEYCVSFNTLVGVIQAGDHFEIPSNTAHTHALSKVAIANANAAGIIEDKSFTGLPLCASSTASASANDMCPTTSDTITANKNIRRPSLPFFSPNHAEVKESIFEEISSFSI